MMKTKVAILLLSLLAFSCSPSPEKQYAARCFNKETGKSEIYRVKAHDFRLDYVHSTSWERCVMFWSRGKGDVLTICATCDVIVVEDSEKTGEKK